MNTYYTRFLKLIVAMVFILPVASCNHFEQKEAVAEPAAFSFVFLTDIHIQPEKNAVEGFKTAISMVNELHPDFVITGGDLIMDALEQPYGRVDTLYNLYNEVVKDIQVPVYNTIGNHEIFGWFEKSGVDRSHPEFGKKIFENRIGRRYYSFDHKGWHFLILDSVEEDEKGYRGGVDSVQMEWIRQDLAGIDAEVPIIVSVHIPFFSMETQIFRGVMEPNSVWSVINNANEVLELFKDHNLKLVLQGHQHFLELIYVRGIYFITGGAVSGAWWGGSFDGTEEGFLLITLKGSEFEWEYLDYGWEVIQP